MKTPTRFIQQIVPQTKGRVGQRNTVALFHGHDFAQSHCDFVHLSRLLHRIFRSLGNANLKANGYNSDFSNYYSGTPSTVPQPLLLNHIATPSLSLRPDIVNRNIVFSCALDPQ